MKEKLLLTWDHEQFKTVPVNFRFVKTNIIDRNIDFLKYEKVVKSNRLNTKQLAVTVFYKPISRIV